MFTGIIQEIGLLKRKTKLTGGILRFAVAAKKLHPAEGESVAVNGTCLTVVSAGRGSFEADVIPETLAKTNLGMLTVGARLNLEPSLRLGDPISGHIVSGHVHQTVRVLQTGIVGPGDGLKMELPKKLAPRVTEKDSVALNGVSLTVAMIATDKKYFTVALTPYTKKHTNLGEISQGDFVNLEVEGGEELGPAQTIKPDKIAIIVSEFNSDVTEKLLASAKKAFLKNKMKNFEVFRVPGAFEIPHRAATLAHTETYAGIIALGCIIQGETDHYRAVCDGVTHGIQKVSIEHRIPVMFGVLMCQTKAQALKRTDKGYECVEGLIELLNIEI